MVFNIINLIQLNKYMNIPDFKGNIDSITLYESNKKKITLNVYILYECILRYQYLYTIKCVRYLDLHCVTTTSYKDSIKKWTLQIKFEISFLKAWTQWNI